MQATRANCIDLIVVMVDQKTFLVTLGQRIQARRKALGLTQAEFGKLVDLSQQVIADYLFNLVKATDLPEPETIMQQLVILVNGATIVAMMEQSSDAAQRAKQAASILLNEKATI